MINGQILLIKIIIRNFLSNREDKWIDNVENVKNILMRMYKVQVLMIKKKILNN